VKGKRIVYTGRGAIEGGDDAAAIDESWLSRESRHQPLTTPRLSSPFF
jgi:hypothetical protein